MRQIKICVVRSIMRQQRIAAGMHGLAMAESKASG
jgi:hypothetical protein